MSRDGTRLLVTLSGKLYVVARATLKVTELPGSGWIDPQFFDRPSSEPASLARITKTNACSHYCVAPASRAQAFVRGPAFRRSSANTQDLRGKILRIRPTPDGGYTIPAGNLFKDAKDGRPEIYIMGCRNPYRLFYDARDRALHWAEVGSNTEERFGTGGFEEINRATTPGNSGWPFVIGPSTPYLRFDHARTACSINAAICGGARATTARRRPRSPPSASATRTCRGRRNLRSASP